jgi:hypothetical protein
VHSMTMKTAAIPRKASRERAKQAAQWLLAYEGAKPSTQFACRAFGTNAPAVRKATESLRNGHGHNGHAPTPAPLTVGDISRWWFATTDADRAALMKSIGVGSAWRAIKANLG